MPISIPSFWRSDISDCAFPKVIHLILVVLHHVELFSKIREAKREIKVYAYGKLAILPSSNLPQGKTGWVTHVLSLSRVIAQKIIKPHHASEATCGFRMECWR